MGTTKVVRTVGRALVGLILVDVQTGVAVAGRRGSVVMVGTGDTLWDIAADHADDGDVLEMMEHIKDLNDLDGGSLQAGQKLRVPA